MKGPEKENKGGRSPTRGVEMLLGDPKAAIRSISGPMMVAMLVMTLYNVADAFWVSGLGPDALAAIGFVFPFFFLFIGFANGIGVGGERSAPALEKITSKKSSKCRCPCRTSNAHCWKVSWSPTCGSFWPGAGWKRISTGRGSKRCGRRD